MSRSPLGFKGLGNVFKIKLINFLIQFNDGDFMGWTDRGLHSYRIIILIKTTIHIFPREGLVLENTS